MNAPVTMQAPLQHYLDQYSALADALPGRAAWLQEQRSAAHARLQRIGLPGPRDEEWRYTPLRPITLRPFDATATAEAAPTADALAEFAIPDLNSHRLVFVDGLYAPALSSRGAPPHGVQVDSLAHVLAEHPEQVEDALGTAAPPQPHGFTALNHAHSRDGTVVRFAADARPTTPLEMLFVSRGEYRLTQPRNLIVSEAGAHGAIIERYVSLGDHCTFTNSTSEILLHANAELDYYLVQTQAAAARHVCGIWARQAAASRLRCHTVTLSGALVRNDLGIQLDDRGAHCDMIGLYQPGAGEHVDNHTMVTHHAPECTSHEHYKGILRQRSRAVFRGRIVVDQDAQKTDAAQTNNNLLLSPNAEVDCKPQLEIYADDVKCSHGATVGQLDQDALFYLRSRGIDTDAAHALLTFAFAGEVIDSIPLAPLKQALTAMLPGGHDE